MKFSTLGQIVTDYAYALKESAAYNGEYGDVGCDNLLKKLNNYKDGVVRLDLRPSGFDMLDNIEVGEPGYFSNIIDNYKIKLARNIKL